MMPRLRALPGLLALGATGLAATMPVASAAELKVPQAKPEIVMDIPDGWAVDQSKSGFEMRSPEKNSIIVGRTLARDKKALDTWRAGAADTLKGFGVSFDPNAKAPPAPTGAPPSADRASAFTTDPDQFTFSGKPSLKTPGTQGSNDQVKAGDNSLENLTGVGAPAAPKMPKLSFKAVQYYGTTLNGKPVDVQLVIYSLPSNRLFVMMQESGSDDGRAVAMAQSVRGAN